MTNPTHTPDAYLFTNEWGDKELLLSLYGEPAQRLLELGWTYSELFARTVDTELLEALKDAREALCNHACHGGDATPCIRSNEQCRAECGKQAGDAIVSIDAAIAKAGSAS